MGNGIRLVTLKAITLIEAFEEEITMSLRVLKCDTHRCIASCFLRLVTAALLGMDGGEHLYDKYYIARLCSLDDSEVS